MSSVEIVSDRGGGRRPMVIGRHESFRLSPQKCRDIEMIVLGNRRTMHGATVRVEGARQRARQLRARLRTSKLGRLDWRRIGPWGRWLQGRARSRQGWAGRSRRRLLVMPGNAECRQLLEQRTAASLRWRRSGGALRLPQRPELILRHLRQVLDLRHSRPPVAGCSGAGGMKSVSSSSSGSWYDSIGPGNAVTGD